MAETSDGKDRILAMHERFEKALNGQASTPLHTLRRDALDRFVQLGLPTTRDEEWRYTNLAPIQGLDFQPSLRADGTPLSAAALAPYLLGGLAASRLVFVDGIYSPTLSDLGPMPHGARICGLAEALGRDSRTLEPYLNRGVRYEGHAFSALNTAFLRDGAFVHLPKGIVVREPIHLLFVSTGHGATTSHPRNLILADSGSQATVIESYIGLRDGTYLTNAATDVLVGQDACLDCYKLQRESREAFHLTTFHARLSRGSRFSSNVVSLGGALVRNEVTTVLDGEGVESTLNGLYLVNGRQHVDNHTWIEHAAPHCTSRELYKGVLDGESTGVFRGRIFVHRAAQKTDAIQSNPNLLLSDKADINTKPQLEIYADDVRCTHGATIGQLDPEAVFYLRARGIGLEESRGVLVRAFAEEVLDLIRVEEVREEMKGLVGHKLDAGRKARSAR